MLILALPRAGMTSADAGAMMDLYFNLLSRAGVTGRMLFAACERFVMAPAGGKTKFFPDPGQLAEMCADDLRARKRDHEGLDKALALLEGPAPAVDVAPRDLRAGLHSLGENLAAMTPPPPPLPITPRESTDAAELQAALAKRQRIAS